MVTVPTNLTIRPAEKVKSDSMTFPYPIKIISGYYSVPGSATTGIKDTDQAKRFAESFVGTEIMFDVILHGDARNRITGHMYMEGSYGEFLFMNHADVTLFTKLNGVWSQKTL